MSIAVPSTDEEWELKDSADTVIKAEAIKRDPELWRRVQEELKRRAKDIISVVDSPSKKQKDYMRELYPYS